MSLQSTPLSLSEENYYFRTKRAHHSTWGSFVHLAFHVRGPLDSSALERALQHLVARHESLRASFVEENGQPRKITRPHLDLPLEVREVPGAGEAALEELVGELVCSPFDLVNGPLIRAYLLRVDEHYSGFVVIAHHLVLDRSSIDTVYRDIGRFYAAELENKTLALPTPVTTVEFARWQRAFVEEHRAELSAYWSAYFQRCVPLDVEVLQAPDRDERAERGVIPFEIAEAVVKAARAKTSRLKVPLVAFAHAVLATLFHRRTQRRGISVGYLTDLRAHYKLHNRDHATADIRETVGCIFVGIPLHVDVDPAESFDALLKKCHDGIVDATAHAEAPPMLVYDGYSAPIWKTFNVILNYQRMRGRFELAGATVDEFRPAAAIETRGRRAQGPIQLKLFEDLPRLSGMLAYDGGVMGAASARALVDEFRRLFEELSA